AEKTLRDCDEILLGRIRCAKLREGQEAGHRGEIAAAFLSAHAGSERELEERRRGAVSLGKNRRLERGDDMGRLEGIAKRGEIDVTDIMIGLAIAPGPMAVHLEHRERLAWEKLARDRRAVGRGGADEGWT